MQISLSETGKRFNAEWIFRNFTYTFSTGNAYAITGPNGSGKSTLLQVIAGAMEPSAGKIAYSDNEKVIGPEHFFRYMSVAAPYQELVEEMSFREFLRFHRKFKPFLPSVDEDDIIGIVGLKDAAGKQIRNYSSGMKQRAKLAQAVFSDTPCLLLDEPCSNFDDDGFSLYNRLIGNYCRDRLVIVSSNEKQEYTFCREIIGMGALKAGTA